MYERKVLSYDTLKNYKVNLVSEHLKDRHPYLELPFNDRYDSSEVYKAVFDREIPKLVEILEMPNLDDAKYRDAFISLNEISSHQENKDVMISADLVGIASQFIASKHLDVRREAMLLLGSLLSVQRARLKVDENTIFGLRNMLYDDHREAREACGWALCRLTIGRDGVDIVNDWDLTPDIIKSFLKYSEKLQNEEAIFLIYLLECCGYVLEIDNSIDYFLKKGILKRVNSILERKDEVIFQEYKNRIHQLCLEFEMKFTMNHSGKQEGIDEEIIFTACKFLISDVFEEIKFAVMVIMSCTILLEGKIQCSKYPNHKIILDLIDLLDHSNQDLHRYVKNTIINISEYPLGAEILTLRLSPQLVYMDEIFGIKMVKNLSKLIPKVNELEKPPILPREKHGELKLFAQNICNLIKNHKDQVKVAIEDTVRLTERLVPFLLFKNDKDKGFQELVANTLFLLLKTEIAEKEPNGREELRNYVDSYGENEDHTLGTNLNLEIYKFPKLYQFLENSLSSNFD